MDRLFEAINIRENQLLGGNTSSGASFKASSDNVDREKSLQETVQWQTGYRNIQHQPHVEPQYYPIPSSNSYYDGLIRASKHTFHSTPYENSTALCNTPFVNSPPSRGYSSSSHSLSINDMSAYSPNNAVPQSFSTPTTPFSNPPNNTYLSQSPLGPSVPHSPYDTCPTLYNNSFNLNLRHSTSPIIRQPLSSTSPNASIAKKRERSHSPTPINTSRRKSRRKTENFLPFHFFDDLPIGGSKTQRSNDVDDTIEIVEYHSPRSSQAETWAKGGPEEDEDEEDELSGDEKDMEEDVKPTKLWSPAQRGYLFEYILGPGNDRRFEKFKVGPGKIHREVALKVNKPFKSVESQWTRSLSFYMKLHSFRRVTGGGGDADLNTNDLDFSDKEAVEERLEVARTGGKDTKGLSYRTMKVFMEKGWYDLFESRSVKWYLYLSIAGTDTPPSSHFTSQIIGL
ncbi:hypothetical protein EV359DRAFT_88086 [Lentinula novae-zelandiae]|nr:hypothetical protein EV359DRAFT_88086 [Lentinula novae-zelandiae]